jgi:hypothetical protein
MFAVLGWFPWIVQVDGMRLLEILLKSIVAPLVVVVLTPTALALGSRFCTGDSTAWFRSFPWWMWTVACVLIIAWVAVILVNRRRACLRRQGGRLIASLSGPIGGWVKVGHMPYQGVLWVVRLPAPPRWGLAPQEAPLPADVDVSAHPRCPLCGTELEESKSFWGGYNWKCVGCGFSKRNRETFYTEASRVERLARRDFERHIQWQDTHTRRSAAR